ncbi:hypothetical protein [Thiolinea disciformis]|uniref:hypothetical protein n=1 Tax=Thiolinea disciformis TaxID=125614 RepID=UPI00035FF3DF|nr:hypothetical protein [Thiolinea disciformis]
MISKLRKKYMLLCGVLLAGMAGASNSAMTITLDDAISVVETQNLAKNNYPIKTSKQEWSQLKDHQAMIDKAQIAKENLGKLTTKELIELSLDYPLFDDVLAHNSIQSGFEQVVRNFNGLQDLLSRDDAAQELVKKYKKLEVNLKRVNLSAEDQVNVSSKIRRLEWILAQDAIVDRLSLNEQKLLSKLALRNIKNKQLDKELYGSLGYESSALVLGKSLMRTNKDALSSTTQELLVSGNGAVAEVIPEIITVGEMANK